MDYIIGETPTDEERMAFEKVERYNTRCAVADYLDYTDTKATSGEFERLCDEVMDMLEEDGEHMWELVSYASTEIVEADND